MKKISYITALIFALSLTAHATLIAYEGFGNGTIGDQTRQTALSGSGFTDMANSNYRFTVTNGLSYTDGSGNTLASTGNASTINPIASGTQNLQLAFTPVTSGKIYVGFLSDQLAVSSFGLMIGLQDAQVDGALSVGPNTTVEAGIRSTSSANSGWGLYNANGMDERSTSAPLGLHFIVMEIDIDNDNVQAWLDPTDLTNISGTSTLLTSGTDVYTVGTVNSFLYSLGGTIAGTIDEIRIGTTFEDVAPIPEPATIGMLGIGALLTFLARRMKGY